MKEQLPSWATFTSDKTHSRQTIEILSTMNFGAKHKV